MGQEIELKLSIQPSAVDAFLAHPLLAGARMDTERLENQYYDTEDQQLTQAGVALRLRQNSEGWVQTLKTRGSNQGGLHQRNEWEMPVPEGQLELDRFPAGSLPLSLSSNQLHALFTTHFVRRRWLLDAHGTRVEVVLDQGEICAGDHAEAISEVELELKSGELPALLDLALRLTERIPMVPSDLSKAERGYRLREQRPLSDIPLPSIVAQQSMESAFCALFGYELERLQRQWALFWLTQQWRHMQALLVTLGNMRTELEWFEELLPPRQHQQVVAWVDWLDGAIRPLVSWWPACFALSQDALDEPESLAISLQQAKAMKALVGVEALARNPSLGHTLMSLTRWLHLRAWREDQSPAHRRASEEAVSDGLDRSLSNAWQAFRPDQFAGSTSHALEQFPAVHRLLMLCQYFSSLYGDQLEHYRGQLEALEANLSRLSAMDIVSHLRDWLNDLPSGQQASVYSWTRSKTILLRDLKQLAGRLSEQRINAQES
ncbi:MAG: CYTH domain-containing protein [Saccharospirillum sp.]